MEFPKRVWFMKCPGIFLQRFPGHFLDMCEAGHVVVQIHFLLPQEIPCILHISCPFQEAETSGYNYVRVHTLQLHVHAHVHMHIQSMINKVYVHVMITCTMQLQPALFMELMELKYMYHKLK